MSLYYIAQKQLSIMYMYLLVRNVEVLTFMFNSALN